MEAPLGVGTSDLNIAEGEVQVHLKYQEVARRTPANQRILHARPPRTECKEHGARVLGWAETSSRFTRV